MLIGANPCDSAKKLSIFIYKITRKISKENAPLSVRLSLNSYISSLNNIQKIARLGEVGRAKSGLVYNCLLGSSELSRLRCTAGSAQRPPATRFSPGCKRCGAARQAVAAAVRPIWHSAGRPFG